MYAYAYVCICAYTYVCTTYMSCICMCVWLYKAVCCIRRGGERHMPAAPQPQFRHLRLNSSTCKYSNYPTQIRLAMCGRDESSTLATAPPRSTPEEEDGHARKVMTKWVGGMGARPRPPTSPPPKPPARCFRHMLRRSSAAAPSQPHLSVAKGHQPIEEAQRAQLRLSLRRLRLRRHLCRSRRRRFRPSRLRLGHPLPLSAAHGRCVGCRIRVVDDQHQRLGAPAPRVSGYSIQGLRRRVRAVRRAPGVSGFRVHDLGFKVKGEGCASSSMGASLASLTARVCVGGRHGGWGGGRKRVDGGGKRHGCAL